MSYLDNLKLAQHDGLVNMMYTRMLQEQASYDEYSRNNDKHGYGLRIPCSGMVAGVAINFTGKNIRIVRGARFIGITTCDYSMAASMPSRLMTEEEVGEFVDLLEAAYAEQDKGGDSEQKFGELWDWFQALEV